ncbi:MAG: TonB-dependent receptor [Candidatus Eisenbacteria bacterium]|uniref:TonB-dependent receptor n=1 Tax=Eiseniibacteriota bacterium TaxID=2212470 RepID=A0A956NGK3_UNCEI|nr:TonB-dependent receptor [Candidatus Eisenbacteria bacterium]
MTPKTLRQSATRTNLLRRSAAPTKPLRQFANRRRFPIAALLASLACVALLAAGESTAADTAADPHGASGSNVGPSLADAVPSTPSDTTAGTDPASLGTIAGKVTDISGRPLDRVNVTVANHTWGGMTFENGEFRIRSLPPGRYTLVFDHIGYERRSREQVSVTANEITNLGTIVLESRAIPLDEVVVSPGTYSMMGRQTSIRQTLSAEDIEIMGWAEDVTRAVQRIPGTSADEFSAQFAIRGGDPDEVLVLLDGMQVYKPFHQKDFGGGLFSTIDIETIGNVDLLTGGFSAEHGDRISGVLDLQTKSPGSRTDRPGSLAAHEGGNRESPAPGSLESPKRVKRTSSIGLSLMNVRGFSMGPVGDGRGSYLVSARRGYLDIVNKLMKNEFKLRPTYYDLFGKLSYPIHSNHELGVYGFLANDSYQLHERVMEPETDWYNIDWSDTKYGNAYAWASLTSKLPHRVRARTLLYGGRVTQRRAWEVFDDDPQAHLNSGTLHDKRDLDLFGLKQDWTYPASAKALVKVGFDVKRLAATYDYAKDIRNEQITASDSLTIQEESFSASPSPDGRQVGAYATVRLQVLPRLTAEAGVRYDEATHSGDQLWSPRLGLSQRIGNRTTLRAGWGKYRQVQGIDDLDIQYGDAMFHPAEEAEHFVVGVEHEFESGLSARLEGYRKDMTNVRDSYYSFRDIDEFFPEARDDLIHLTMDGAKAEGIELLLRNKAGERFTWWLSYVYADAKENVVAIDYGGPMIQRTGWLPRVWDQRQTVNLDANYRLSDRWQFSFAWKYRTGWPSTDFTVARVERPDGTFAYYHDLGEFRGTRVPSYQRLDARVNRKFRTSHGTISTFLQVINLYNHMNVIRYDHDILQSNDQTFKAEIGEETWFGILPFLGVSCEF